MAGEREVRLDRDPAGVVEFGVGHLGRAGGQAGGGDAGRPDDGARRNALRAAAGGLDGDRFGVDAHAVGEATAPSIGANDGIVIISGSGETPVTVHLARLAVDFGARILAVTTRAYSTLAGLADAVIEVPTTRSAQFGGSLFEQSALLLLDAVIIELTAGDPQAHVEMQARHANLQ